MILVKCKFISIITDREKVRLEPDSPQSGKLQSNDPLDYSPVEIQKTEGIPYEESSPDR